jgi:hypothetical protein
VASGNSSTSSRTPRIRQHYLIAPPDSTNNTPRLKCRYCTVLYAQSTGSSVLARHLRHHHPETMRIPDPRQTDLSRFFLISKASERALLETVYDWMIADLQDYSVIEHPQFIAMMKAFNQSVTLPVRQTARQHISAKFDITRAMVVDALHNVDHCSLTTDGWTSVGSHQFLSLTCHYVDRGWRLKSIVLDCIPFQQPHTGSEIKMAIARLLEEFGLVGKVSAITTDSASNMVAAMRDLSAEMRAIGQEVIHVRCGAHMLHRIVTVGLESEHPAIAEIRESVTRIRASPRLLELLDGFQAGPGKLRPILDVRTRWNSTFEMLKRALELKSGINAINASGGVQIAETSWDAATKVCRFLDLFNNATQTLSSESAPTIALVLAVFHRIKAHVREAVSCPELVNMATLMMAKIDSYADFYSNTSLAPASLLDPRIRPVLEKYDQAACSNGRLVLEEQFSVLATHQEIVPMVEDGQGIEALFSLGLQCDVSGNEMKRFFEHTGVTCHVGLLQWWASNEGSFPTLARLARRHLAMQATSVSSERLFSTAGMILSPTRSRLSPESARELICLQNWIQALEKR